MNSKEEVERALSLYDAVKDALKKLGSPYEVLPICIRIAAEQSMIGGASEIVFAEACAKVAKSVWGNTN
jgi:hypothetical protein